MVAVALLVPVAASACFRERRETVQKESAAYIKFTGNTDDAEFRVERSGSALWPRTRIEDGEVYEVKPGPCVVIVERAGRLIMRRDKLCVDGETTEVAIP